MIEKVALADIKQALQQATPNELRDLCVRLARFKQDNKQLLHYALFYQDRPEVFIEEVNVRLKEAVETFNYSHAYWVKKGLRKWQRQVNLLGRISGEPWVQAKLQGMYALACYEAASKVAATEVLTNLCAQATKKFYAQVAKLEADWQHDLTRTFERSMKSLENH